MANWVNDVMFGCKKPLAALFVLLTFGLGAHSAYAEELNIYSHRQEFLINPFLKAFTAKTVLATNVVFASKGLAERFEREGENTPAHVVFTVEIARLPRYKAKCLFAAP